MTTAATPAVPAAVIASDDDAAIALDVFSPCEEDPQDPATSQQPTMASADIASSSTTSNSFAMQKSRLLIQKTHAAFVSKLYAMVADETTDALISWTTDGDCFKVTDPVELARVVLPVYFKHGNWHSFVRQLNMYGFHKINDLAYGGVFGDTQLWMFKHEFFLRGEVKLLQKIKRRGPKPTTQQQLQTQVQAQSQAHSDTNDSPSTEPSPLPSALPPLEQQPTALNAPVIPTSPSESTLQSATESNVVVADYMGEYIAELKTHIAELRQSNCQLHHENQTMHTRIMDFQGAFSGIMSFLETAIVRPNVHRSANTELTASVVDAFRKLSNDIAPVIFSQNPKPSSSIIQQNCQGASASASLSPTSFRTERFQSQPSDHHSYSNNFQQSPTSTTAEHICSCSSVSPIRPCCCTQPSSFTGRIPNLSLPTQETSSIASVASNSSSNSTILCPSHARRSSSSSSGSSSGSSTVLDESSISSSNNSTPVFVPEPFIATSTRICTEKSNNEESMQHSHDHYRRYTPTASTLHGNWSRQHYSTHLESSLRETLPAKRPRVQ